MVEAKIWDKNDPYWNERGKRDETRMAGVKCAKKGCDILGIFEVNDPKGDGSWSHGIDKASGAKVRLTKEHWYCHEHDDIGKHICKHFEEGYCAKEDKEVACKGLLSDCESNYNDDDSHVVSYEWEWNNKKEIVQKYLDDKKITDVPADLVWIKLSKERKYDFIYWYKEVIKGE